MHNPGSVLQAWALQQYIDGLGYDSRIIDYRPHYFYSEGSNLKLLAKKLLYHKQLNSRRCKFDSFIYSNMNLTPTYYSPLELNAESNTADVTIAGSDQLWNTDFQCGQDDAFYLDFVKTGRKISYSTSVGKAMIDENNLARLFLKLPNFDYISVREKSTAITLSSLLNRDVAFVCDPVLLLSPDKYDRFIVKKRPIADKYVMVYLSPKCLALDNLVKKYQEAGYKIALVGGFSKRCYCDYHIKDAGPEDFLSYIYHAETVVSNSFHATAFSILFHKNFWSILPEGNSERIQSLLSVTQLQNRAIDKNSNIYDINELINWDNVDFSLMQYIKGSMSFLNHALS